MISVNYYVKEIGMCRAIARIILRSIFTPVIKITSYLPHLSSERVSNFLSAIAKVKITDFIKCHSILLALMCACLTFLFSASCIFEIRLMNKIMAASPNNEIL